MDAEAKSYNFLNIALSANYEALKRLWDQHQSWRKAWEKEKNKYPPVTPAAEQLDCELILRQDPRYPALLKETAWPPLGIYLQGQLSDRPAIAIVGTRRATPNGKTIAKTLAKELSRQGATIISGLAMGIDEAAHQGAVEAGGQTVAVLPTGLDRIYPAQHENLAKTILDSGGALISEYPFNYPTYPSNFVHRNRIVSGLSSAVIVVEAPEKSGALITARFALDQNREVMAVPGPANHPNYSGSHKLIRDGAKLVSSAEEILEELNWNRQEESGLPASNIKISEEEKIILNAIQSAGSSAAIDKISEITKIEIPKVNQIITLLTLKGILKE